VAPLPLVVGDRKKEMTQFEGFSGFRGRLLQFVAQQRKR